MQAEATHNTHIESDGLPFRCAPGQAAAHVERWAAHHKPVKLALMPAGLHQAVRESGYPDPRAEAN